MKKVYLFHPLKHHLFYSGRGITKAKIPHISTLYFGFYNNNSFLNFLLSASGKTQHLGYRYPEIDRVVKTFTRTKVLFLLQNFKKSYRDKFIEIFGKYALKKVNEADVIHVINSTENFDLIQKAHTEGKIVVLEQIVGHDYKYYLSGIITNHDKDTEIAIYRQNLINADYVLCPSEFVINSITMHSWGGEMENKLRLIPYGVDLDMFSYVKRVWKPGTTLKILTVAGVSLRKGINYLLDAMDELQGYNIKLSVLGVPIGEEGSALVARMKDMKNVDYRGSVSHIEINKAYQDNDLFILPSLVEGSALSVYEALATGMPCIVTNNTGSVVDNGVDGFIIEEESAKSIVQAIQCIYTQEINIEHMSVSARRKAENYSWNHFEDRIASFYDSIL